MLVSYKQQKWKDKRAINQESIKNKGSKGGRNFSGFSMWALLVNRPLLLPPPNWKIAGIIFQKKNSERKFSPEDKTRIFIFQICIQIIFHFHFFLILNSKIIIGLIDFVQFWCFCEYTKKYQIVKMQVIYRLLEKDRK